MEQLAADVKVLDEKVNVIASRMSEEGEDLAEVKAQTDKFLQVRGRGRRGAEQREGEQLTVR